MVYSWPCVLIYITLQGKWIGSLCVFMFLCYTNQGYTINSKLTGVQEQNKVTPHSQ